ncbi:hypothetical protein ASPCAL11704 [Aspergillus calidoustus]|uniref:Uncharacterized protein n=1 Tax=Aspergillus calidoustus TaxID=454130 RepID=A0A0U5GA81_ASPCI|nr:hypothetical protein ASPCAL11704 [Aspergillus calidoustus]
MQFKTLLLLPALAATATATVQVAFSGFYYEACAAPSVTATTFFEGSCGGVQNIPLKSFTASIYAGACEDSATTPFVKLYTESGCVEDSFYGEFEVAAEESCFEVEGTFEGYEVVCQ